MNESLTLLAFILKIYENNMNGKSSKEISFNSLFYYIYSEVYLKFVYY